jgi:hypothetical protein
MNKLYTFGCSYTAPYVGNNIPTYKKYREFKGGEYPKTWPELLSKKLNLSLVNYGIGGSGNDLIFETFCDNSDKLKKGDTVIIEWSYHTRVNYKFDLSSDILDEIFVGRNQQYYMDQVYKYEKLIDLLCKLIGVNVYYWSADCVIIYTLDKSLLHNKKYLMCNKVENDENSGYTPFNTVFKLGGQTIKMETNGQIDDLHFGETGHSIMADLFYDHIINFKKNMI